MKISKEAIPVRMESPGTVMRSLPGYGGMTVAFNEMPAGTDIGPLLEGLEHNSCQCPHWGYVLKGKMTARYADRDEVYEAGDAFYSPPGHVPVQHEPGTEFVWFSPSEELRTAEAVMFKNMQAMQDGSTT